MAASLPSLEQQQLPPAQLDQPCDDDHLLELSCSVTRWQSIFPFLGLDETDEESIIEKYPPERRRLEMLRRWKMKFGQAATYRKLIEALNRVKRQDLVDRVMNLLTKDINARVQQPAITLDNPTSVPPAVQSYTGYLKRRYRSQVPTFSTQWPPPPTNKVFNLAMIRKERVERGVLANNEFVQLTIHGSVDDILELKTPVKLENIFSRDEASRKVILIEGAPGSGKTTLAWHICHKWESGELFQEFSLVVLVQLRDPDIQSARSISDLLPCSSMLRLHSVCSEIEASEGRGVLWVLDGWDELPPHLQQSSLFHQLIRPPRVSPFTESAVVVTSRPISSADLHPLVSSRVEVIGFTEAQIKEYFTESLKHDDQAVQKLEHHLSLNPVVESSCYLPLNAAIVVHLFLALGCTLPTSLHMTFCLIIANCVYRYLKDRANRGSEMPPLSSVGHSGDIWSLFPPDIRTYFRNICHLAYVGIHENKLAFLANDLQRYGLSAPLHSLGLLREVESFVSVGRSVSYNFLHLSVQELLAAFHISEMSPADQVKTFQSHMDNPRFVSILQFYAGITKLQTPGIQSVIVSGDKGVISRIRCLHEAQDVHLCLSVAEVLDWKLLLAYHTSPIDCLSVGYFSSCVCSSADSQRELIVNLAYCCFGDIGVKYLMRGIMSAGRSTLNSSTTVHSGNTCRLTLELHYNEIHSNGVHYIAEALKSCTLMSTQFPWCIRMQDNPIREDGFVHIAQALVSNTSLVELALPQSSIQITDHSGPVVVEMLWKNKSLQQLDLSANYSLSDSGALYIAEGLKHNTVLTVLILEKCFISYTGAKSIAKALAVNKSLRLLTICHSICLRYTKLGGEELLEDVKMTRSPVHLQNNNQLISDEEVEDLEDMLVVNNTLKQLGLNLDHIQGSQLLKLGTCLKSNSTLSSLILDLHSASSHRDSLKQFVLSLADNCCLRTLFLLTRDHLSLAGEVKVINTTKRQRGHPQLKVTFFP